MWMLVAAGGWTAAMVLGIAWRIECDTSGRLNEIVDGLIEEYKHEAYIKAENAKTRAQQNSARSRRGWVTRRSA